MPIRWDNVGGASLSEASRPLEVAQRSFLGAFDTLGNTLQQRQTMEDQNWQNTRTNNTNAFLDAVSKYRTPEALKAAQDSGELDTLRAGFGNQIDQAQARQAAEQRMASLQQNAKAEIEYNHMATDERTAPVLDRYRQAVLSNDTQGAAAAQADYVKLGGRDIAGTVAYADKRAQELVGRGRDTTLFQNQVTKAADEHLAAGKNLKVADANIAQSYAGVRASDSQVQRNKFEQDRQTKLDEAAMAAGRAEAAKQALKSVGNIYADGVYNGTQSDDLLQTMTKNGIGSNTEQRTEVIRKLNQIQKDGIEISTPDGKQTIKVKDLPMSAVTAAVNASYNPLFSAGWNSGVGKKMADNLKVILSQQYTNPDGTLSSKPVEDLAAFQQTIANARQNAAGIIPRRAQPPGK